MLLQEEQLSDFLPVHVEFSRFSDGSKLNSSPLCRRLLNDGTKIGNFYETYSIVSCFFTFWGKISGFAPNYIVPFHSFLRFFRFSALKFVLLQHAKRY